MTFRIVNIIFGAILIALLVLNRQASVAWYYFLGLGLIYSLIVFWGTINLSAEFFGPAKCKGSSNNNSIAITFDDGPQPGTTERVLNILKQHQAKATFFCIGKNVKLNPTLVKRMIDEGHLVGNHSFKHSPFFDLMPRWRMRSEINNTNSVIAEATGLKPRFFRPPFGVINPTLASAINKSAMVSIGWSIRSFDTTAKDPKQLLERVTQNLKAGDIILFHDRCAITADILPDLFSFIAKAGLKVEPLDQLIGEKAYA